MNKLLLCLLLLNWHIVYGQFEVFSHPAYLSKDSILKLINNYNISKPEYSFYPQYFSAKYNIDDSVKNGLLRLMQKTRWNEDEIKAKTEVRLRDKFEYLYFEHILDSSITITKAIFFSRFADIHRKAKSNPDISLSKSISGNLRFCFP